MEQISAEKPRVSTIVLLIQVREGVTRKLWNLAMGDPERALKNQYEKGSSIFPSAELSPIVRQLFFTHIFITLVLM